MLKAWLSCADARTLRLPDRDSRVCAARCDYFRIQEAGLPRGSGDFDAIRGPQLRPATAGLGLKVEGVCFRADGKAQ